jgi:hypothetical protein
MLSVEVFQSLKSERVQLGTSHIKVAINQVPASFSLITKHWSPKLSEAASKEKVDENYSPSPCRDVDALPGRPIKRLFLTLMNIRVGRGEDNGGGLGSAKYEHFEDELSAPREGELAFRKREMPKEEPEGGEVVACLRDRSEHGWWRSLIWPMIEHEE